MGKRVRTVLSSVFFVACAPLALATAFTDYQKLHSQGKFKEAVDVLRNEIASPSLAHSFGSQPVYIRQHLLRALGDYAHANGITPELDAEAHKIYEEGMAKFAGDDGERQSLLANGLALFYSITRRNGRGLPYMRKELEYWVGVDNKFRMVLVYDAIATSYWDMGERELSEVYQKKALEVAEGYFVFGERPRDVNEWNQYSRVLRHQMNFAVQVGDQSKFDRLFKLHEPIEPKYVGTTFSWYSAAQYQAMVGRFDEAQATIEKARNHWKEAPSRFRNNDRIARLAGIAEICSVGSVDVWTKSYASAAKNLEDCLERMNKEGMRENEANFMLRLGIAYENTGAAEKAVAAYRKSIAASEATRGSFSVAERAQFFRNFPRLSYWGLTRLQAKRAAAGDEAAFFEAAFMSEQVRGRQLGELVDAEMSKRISAQSMKALQARLPADTAVLAYTLTDDEIILLAMARDRVVANVAPYDAKLFAAQARAAAADLSKPQSSQSDLNGRLLALSKPVLGPARALLAGKKRVIALPDGVLNTIPFELLSSDDGAYRPLLADYVVSASPSLVFIQYAERQRHAAAATNLMALADPKYAKPKALGGAAVEEVIAATRGSRFLEYFSPLPETRTEAQAIAKMFEGQKVTLLAGDEALESRVKALDLSQFGFLHFATHGILGGEVPGIGEPALVLGEEPGEDGFLTSAEVGKLRISAELTVLSACNTGSGEFVSGEGVMGMSRAFLAAGSRSVVVSLWPVASKQTEALMVDFYRQLRAGQPAADALRAAKLERIERAQKTNSIEAHPFFWAAFIMLGG